MAWVEQVGRQRWRVRFRDGMGVVSLYEFRSEREAQDFADDMATDRRRGVWLDPRGAATPVVEWAERWIESVDVEPRTEENYRSRLTNHILPQWGHREDWGDHRFGGDQVVQSSATAVRGLDGGGTSHGVVHGDGRRGR